MFIQEPIRIVVDEAAHPQIAKTLVKRRGYRRHRKSCGHGTYVAAPDHVPDLFDGVFCAACQADMNRQEEKDLERENVVARTLIADAGEHRRAISARIDCAKKTVVLGKGRVVVGFVRRIDQTVRSSLAIPISVNKLHIVDVIGRHWSAWVPLDNWHRGIDAYALLIPRAVAPEKDGDQEPDNVRRLPQPSQP